MKAPRCRQDALCARVHHRCDCCSRMVHTLRSVGRDACGDPDGPDVCVVCENHTTAQRWAMHLGHPCPVEAKIAEPLDGAARPR